MSVGYGPPSFLATSSFDGEVSPPPPHVEVCCAVLTHYWWSNCSCVLIHFVCESVCSGIELKRAVLCLCGHVLYIRTFMRCVVYSDCVHCIGLSPCSCLAVRRSSFGASFLELFSATSRLLPLSHAAWHVSAVHACNHVHTYVKDCTTLCCQRCVVLCCFS